MSDIKEVTVSITPQELTSRKRRRTRKVTDDVTQGGFTDVMNVERMPAAAPAPAPVVASVPVAPPAYVMPAPAPAPAPAVIPTSMVMPPVAAPAPEIHIAVKKNYSEIPRPVSQSGGSAPKPVIIAQKKRSLPTVAAKTLKKPKLVISAVVTPPHKQASTSQQGGVAMTSVAAAAAAAPRKRRRFTERRISIEVKGAAATRKNHKHLKNKIDAMPIESIRKFLLRKGIVKSKTSMPPDDMLRSMMRDFLLLHTAD